MIKYTDIQTLALRPTSAKAAAAKAGGELRAHLLSQIAERWPLFDQDDLEKIVNFTTLTQGLARRYEIEEGEAHRDARAFLNGRHF